MNEKVIVRADGKCSQSVENKGRPPALAADRLRCAGTRGVLCQPSLWLLKRGLPETAAAEARAVIRHYSH